MCGIVGYVGKQEAVPVLMEGLSHLEYRGYDSAGLACLENKTGKLNGTSFHIIKEKGKLSQLRKELVKHVFSSNAGIGHTRWATHGEPSRANAHPHTDSHGQIVLVHNGIVENYAALKEELIGQGYKFHSQTDTEVAANLIGSYYKKGQLLEAVRKAVKRLHGFFAFVVMAKDEPGRLIVFKRSNPLVVGLGKGENFVASDVPALLPYTQRVLYLEDDELAVLTKDEVQIIPLASDKPIKRTPSVIRWNVAEAQKGGYPHFMLKEIHEQPAVVKTILTGRMKHGHITFDSITPKIIKRLSRIEKIHFVSCGTAYHAGLVGNYMMGECLGLPIEATVSSEFRYEDPCVDEKDLVILITQSGETADTLAALREAKSRGAFTLAIVNVVGSTIAREADCVIYTHAGPEIGVASTKAYIAQLTVILLLSLYLAEFHPKRKPGFTAAKARAILKNLPKLPAQIREVIHQGKHIKQCSKKLFRHRNFLYLGRGYNFPSALEGALKLKEITYAHAHGYPAGEMKHGPIALIDNKQPVICICPASSITYEKMLSNIEEIKARKGIIISIGTKGDRNMAKLSKETFFLPDTNEMLTPVLAAIPLQLLAYYIAVFNGRDVDQPRNLAKSVTVE